MADPVVKRIVCLANSRKLSGGCVVGKDLRSGDWTRPESDRMHGEVAAILMPEGAKGMSV